MKKLIIAAAFVAGAMFANAASVSWQSGVVFAPGSDGTISYTSANRLLSNGNVSMYVFATTGNELDSYKAGDGYKWVSGGAAAPVVAQSYTGTDKSGKVNGNTGVTTGTYNADDVVKSVIVFTYKDGAGKDWYLENTGSVTINSLGADGTLGNLFRYPQGNSGLTQNAAWTAASVPEPTSGLLLLLGMAGLALRRRRA